MSADIYLPREDIIPVRFCRALLCCPSFLPFPVSPPTDHDDDAIRCRHEPQQNVVVSTTTSEKDE